MQINIDFTSLSSETNISRELPERTRQFVRSRILKVSQSVLWRVKNQMPVDTGHARATWGILTPELFVYVSTQKRPPTQSIWRVENGGMSIVQGSSMTPHNYIDDLNLGHSRQAPPLFLNVIQEQAADELVRELT